MASIIFKGQRSIARIDQRIEIACVAHHARDTSRRGRMPPGSKIFVEYDLAAEPMDTNSADENIVDHCTGDCNL